MLSIALSFSLKNAQRNSSYQKAVIVKIVQQPNDNEREKDINYVIHANFTVFFCVQKKNRSKLCAVSFKIPQKL